MAQLYSSGRAADTSDRVRLYRDSGGMLRALNSAGAEVPVLPQSIVADHLAADFVTTSAVQSDTGLGFAGAAGETWVFDFHGMGTISTAAGVRFRLAGPASSPLRANILANTTSASNLNAGTFLTSVNADTGTIWTLAATELNLYLGGAITFATAGELKLQMRAVTGGDTATLLAFSRLRATRVG